MTPTGEKNSERLEPWASTAKLGAHSVAETDAEFEIDGRHGDSC
jgi:hypothetical protein